MIWGLRHSSSRLVHVVLDADRGHRSRPGIRVHRSRHLAAPDRALVRGIPVTSVARTLADLGDVAPPAHVRSAFAAAERLQLLDMDAIDAAVTTAAGRRRGARILSEVLRGYDPRWSQTRSDLELAMLDVLAAYDLPAPQVVVSPGVRSAGTESVPSAAISPMRCEFVALCGTNPHRRRVGGPWPTLRPGSTVSSARRSSQRSV